MPQHSRFASWLFTMALLTAVLSFGQTSAPRSKQARAAQPASSAAASYKGILEPVNYSADINLRDVFFTSTEEGWVTGEHATILHTIDGGKNWIAEVGGDPRNHETSMKEIRFLDRKHGWVLQNGTPGVAAKLLRTMDGENWEEVNAHMPAEQDYVFTSVRHGIAISSGNPDGQIFVTNDGGRSWKMKARCVLNVRVQGLAQTEYCWFGRLRMVSAQVGYAQGSWRSPEVPNSFSVALFKTENGGESWAPLVPPMIEDHIADSCFTDANHGIVVFQGGKTYVTSDGGANWRALLATSISEYMQFADPEVGMALKAGYSDLTIDYTSDGGQHWKNGTQVRMPTKVQNEFAFPRRDRAYFIGDHGMIYRYRIVPASYSAANTLTAPLMPAFGGVDLASKAEAIRRDIQQIQGQMRSSGSFSPDSITAVQSLQSDTAGFAQQAPIVAAQYQPLSLPTAGAQWVASLTSQAQNLLNLFQQFKQAANPQSASAALQQLSTSANTAQQTASTGVQNPGGWFASNAPADFVQDAGPTSSITPRSTATDGANLATVAAGGASGAALSKCRGLPSEPGEFAQQKISPRSSRHFFGELT